MEALNIVKDTRQGCMDMPQNSVRFIRHEWHEWADKLKKSGDSQLESIGQILLEQPCSRSEREVM